MTRTTRIRRLPAPAFSATVALSCAVMLMVLITAFTRVISWRPLRFEGRLMLRPLTGADWGAPWTVNNTITAADQQITGFNQLGLVVLVLSLVGAMVAAASFIALNLGAASVRRREFATRAALGASPRELIVRLASDAARLAGIAFVIGTAAGSVATGITEIFWPHALVAQSFVEQVARTGLTALLVCTSAVVVTVFFAYLTVVRGPLAASLTGGSRITATAGELQVRDALAVLQFAGVLVLLSGAFVLARESRPNLAADSPARPDLYVARLELQGPTFDDEATRAALLQALQQQIADIPGVRAETLASAGAWLGLGSLDMSIVECGKCFRGGMYTPFDAPRVRVVAVAPGFFELFGVAVEQGRSFTAADSLGAPLAAMVNRPLANTSFEAGKPVGKQAQPHGMGAPVYIIAGATAPTRAPVVGSAGDLDNVLYLSALQRPPRSVDVLVLVDDAATALAGLEQLRRTLPPGATLAPFFMSEDVIRDLAAPLRFLSTVLALMAALVLLLGLHGSYALQHFRVLNLQRDLGVRLALGADPRRLTQHVLRSAFNLVIAGFVIGGFGALAAMRTVQLLVPTAPAFAPDLFVMISAVLSVAALIGALRPARRAGRVEPLTALTT